MDAKRRLEQGSGGKGGVMLSEKLFQIKNVKRKMKNGREAEVSL